MKLAASILFGLWTLVLLTGCPADRKTDLDPENRSPTPPGETQALPSNPRANALSERDRVDELRKTRSHSEQQDPFSLAVKRIDELGGRIDFDSAGNLIAVDLAADRVSATDQDVELLGAFAHLERLKLSGPKISSAAAEIIVRFPNLTELALQDTQIDDEGLRQFAQLPALASLNVRRSSNLSDRALAELKDFPSLAYLALVDNNFTGAGIASLVDVPQLRLLDLRGCTMIDHSALECLWEMENLECLKLGGQTVGDGSLAVLVGIENLKDLAIEDSPITNQGLSQIRGLPLESLTIFRCYGIDDRGLVHLKDFVNLERLSLRDTPINGSGLIHVADKRQLRSLELGETGVDDAALEHVSKLTGLERLGLRQTMISDVGLEQVWGLANLEHLDLEDDGITDAGIARLLNLAKLKHLNLKLNAEVSDASIDGLSQLRSLETLNLTQTAVTENAANRLRDALPGCRIVR